MADWTREFSDESLVKALRKMHDETDVMKPFTRTVLSEAADQIAEYSNWKSGKIGAEEHYAALREIERLKAEIAELRERERWIPVIEKLPTKADADAFGRVIGNDGNSSWALEYWLFSDQYCAAVCWRPLPAMPGETKGAD